MAICTLLHESAISPRFLGGLGGFLGGDEPFDGAQRVGVQAGRHQPGVQGVGPGRPAPVDPLGLVEQGVGAQRVEFMPGELVAGGEPERGVGGVPAGVQQVRVTGGGPGRANAGADGQRGAVGGHQPAGCGDGDRLGRVTFGTVQVPADPGVLGEVGQGSGELGQVVTIPEHRGRRGQVPAGRRGVPGGQGQATQDPVTPGHIRIPAIPPADVDVAQGEHPGRVLPPGAGQEIRPPDPAKRVQVTVLIVLAHLDLVGGEKLLLGLCRVADQDRETSYV